MGDRRFKVKRKYNVERVWEKHEEIGRQVVLGRKNTEIAESIGCTPQTVSNVRNSPLVKAKIDAMGVERTANAVDMATRIEEFAPIAQTLLESIVTGETSASIALRARVAGQHMNRAGYAEVRKIQSMHAHLSREDIEAIKERALNSARAAGMIVDIEATESD